MELPAESGHLYLQVILLAACIGSLLAATIAAMSLAGALLLELVGARRARAKLETSGGSSGGVLLGDCAALAVAALMVRPLVSW